MSEHDPQTYYFADGKRVPLEVDREHVAVDLRHAAAQRLSAARRSSLTKGGVTLRRGLVLVDTDDLARSEREILDSAGALLPAFKSSGALVVVLPEVRAEGRDRAQLARIHEFLSCHDVDPASVKERGSRVSFAPRSGRALDALQLANQLYDEIAPAASQTRFLRVVRKP